MFHHCTVFLKKLEELDIPATDEEAINAFQLVSRMEGFVSPSLEPSHAFAEAIKIAPSLSKDTVIVVDSCGDSAKDSRIIAERLGYKI